MTSRSTAGLPVFSVRVTFFCEGEPYGHEFYEIPAANEAAAIRCALKRSEESIYDDHRIPDRRREAEVDGDPAQPELE